MSDGSRETSVDAARTVRELRELHALTGDADGAQRVCWTPTWRRARDWYAAKLDGLPVERTVDAAGNVWTTLPGDTAESVVVGSHLDSVPGGGWLDGALGVLAGLEVLRGVAAQGRPRRTLRIVDWADEEGTRFGYGMLGSSAVSGTLDVEHARALRDREGARLPDVLLENGVDLDRMGEASSGLENAVAYVELHIEQGPVLERLGQPLAAVTGTIGVERHSVTFDGQTAHAGSTPMEDRRDTVMAAARFVHEVRDDAVREDGRATVGRIVTEPGIPVAVPGRTTLVLDQRHADADTLARLLGRAEDTAARIAAEEDVTVSWQRIWGIEPIGFDASIVRAIEDGIATVGAPPYVMPSGPLHDAAEVARAGVPTGMLFVKSLRGLSHTNDEDSDEADLRLSVEALAAIVERLLDA